jgi:hypothetical protein
MQPQNIKARQSRRTSDLSFALDVLNLHTSREKVTERANCYAERTIAQAAKRIDLDVLTLREMV